MPKVTDHRRIEASSDALFALSQDYYLRRHWDPFTRKIEFLDGAQAAALGVRARGRSWHGFSMEVEYIAFNPPRQAAMKMVRGPVFFSHYAGSWIFEQVDPTSTMVIFQYTYKLKWPWLSFLIRPLIQFVFERDVRARLDGMKKAVEEDGVLERFGAAG